MPKLRASFCWAFDGEIPRFATLVWSFLFVLYFSLLLGAPIAMSWSQFLTIERFPRVTQQISRKKCLGMISIIAPKWRYMETICGYYRCFRDFLFRIIRQRFTPPLPFYRYTYQLGRLKSRIFVIHFRYLSRARPVWRIVNHKYISNW